MPISGSVVHAPDEVVRRGKRDGHETVDEEDWAGSRCSSRVRAWPQPAGHSQTIDPGAAWTPVLV